MSVSGVTASVHVQAQLQARVPFLSQRNGWITRRVSVQCFKKLSAWSLLHIVKPLVLYDVYRGVVMEPMQGNLASSQFDFGFTKQFLHSWGDISVLLVL